VSASGRYLRSAMEVGEKFAKYPVDTDQIAPSFQDELADIPPIHRHQINRVYKDQKQLVMNAYQPYLERLKKNSELRINQNKNYQNFIKELNKKDEFSDTFDFFGQNDLQLTETLNIMKDLILFMDLKQGA
jgi:carboxyl-terminal processing protease